VPFLVRRAVCRVFGLDQDEVRVHTARVGGGFGGKQEMLAEDLVTLAVLRTGRPVSYEFSRRDEFVSATCRHPMRVRVRAGARSDGTLAALAVDVLADAGAYGNHSPSVLHHGVSESLAVYRCPHKRVDGKVVYTNHVPSGAFRGYGLGQVVFAVESAIDELACRLGMDPIAFRRRNIVHPGDELVGAAAEPDLAFGSYGLDQCLDLVERVVGAWPDDDPAELGPGRWRVGTGVAQSMIATVPPDGHHSHAAVHALPDGSYRLDVGTVEFGNGSTTALRQLAAAELGVAVERIALRHADTDLVPHDTGAFASTGVTVAGRAVVAACRALRNGGAETASGTCDGSQRSVAFNVHAVRVAVDLDTGRVRVLRSAHAADAGRVINPRQCRGQIEGGVAQALGAALFEQLLVDDTPAGQGRVVTDTLRHYHIPQFADAAPIEVLFADTCDAFGPHGAKSMSESPYNPVAPALANAVRAATGARLYELPMTPDKVWRAII
jgi:CO/xanthine dehydrogenase Mo-binding subunit